MDPEQLANDDQIGAPVMTGERAVYRVVSMQDFSLASPDMGRDYLVGEAVKPEHVALLRESDLRRLMALGIIVRGENAT